mgnify:FL=1
MTKEEWETNLRGVVTYEISGDGAEGNLVPDCKTKGWNKAFRGYLQLRTFVEENYEIN